MNQSVNATKSLFSKIDAKAVARYTMLPGIIPRIRGLGMHFGHFAYLIALVFRSARLIPAGHPTLHAANIGQFGVKYVIALAANTIQWKWKNIDQIAIFTAVGMGIALIFLQLITIATMALVEPASANSTTTSGSPDSFFTTPNENEDLAFVFLSQVFGTEIDMFGPGGVNSSGNPLSGTTGNPLHSAMKSMLALYSSATMVIAVIIVLYYILTVIGEAAKTGTPFGSRFNSLWAPIRLIVALGLLVPLATGLNSAQYITLWMAKMGSGLGTQVWLKLSDEIKNSPRTAYNVQLEEKLFLHNVVENAFIAAVCAKAHTDHEANGGSGGSWTRLLMSGDTTNSFVYNWRGPDDAPHNRRSCGSVSVSFPEGQEQVYQGDNMFGLAARESAMPTGEMINAVKPVIDSVLQQVDAVAGTYEGGLQDEQTISQLRTIAEQGTEQLTQAVSALYENEVGANLQELMDAMDGKGWMYSGVWYMQLSRTMQSAYQQRTKAVPGVIIPEKYTDPDSATFWQWLKGSYQAVDGKVHAARTLVQTYDLTPSAVSAAGAAVASSYDSSCLASKTESGADMPIMEKLQCIITSTFVPQQLTALSRDPTLNPMDVLVAAGGSILARSYELAVWGFGAKVSGGILSGIPIIGGIGQVASEIGGMLITIAFVGFGAGIILYFLLPVFPFMYFLFAVVAWVMEIFEAMVAMPLWALAHLNISGDGMPGDKAIQGYHLLLAILLRPALIVFGLLGSTLIFYGGIFLLQMLFTPLLEISREEGLYGLETMLFTVIFAYIAYMLGLSCFKMVDTIPNQILRWLGSGAQTFGDQRPDSVGSAQSAFLGGAVLGNQAAQGVGGLGSAIGQGAGKAGVGAAGMLLGGGSGAAAGAATSSQNSTDGTQPQQNGNEPYPNAGAPNSQGEGIYGQAAGTFGEQMKGRVNYGDEKNDDSDDKK